MKKRIVILSFLIVIAVGVSSLWLMGHGKETTDDATLEAHVIPISPKVSGYITMLNIRDNQPVRQGDVLVEIDPRDYALRLAAAQANLASAEVSARNAATNAQRQIAMGRVAGSQRDLDNALANEATAKAAVDNAKAQVDLAAKDLADTKIIAPQDGVVTMRSAEAGAFVTTGQQLFTLVGTERWVIANFKEVQITDMRPDQPVDIKVDAYPDLKLTGKIDSIQAGTGARFSAFPPQNATGNFVKIVQRVPVKIVFDQALPQNIVLGPGLSVQPTVHTEPKVTP